MDQNTGEAEIGQLGQATEYAKFEGPSASSDLILLVLMVIIVGTCGGRWPILESKGREIWDRGTFKVKGRPRGVKWEGIGVTKECSF